jgi:hypothetical protein
MSIVDVLKINSLLKKNLKLRRNDIRSDSVVAIADALNINSSLILVSLSGNQVGNSR